MLHPGQGCVLRKAVSEPKCRCAVCRFDLSNVLDGQPLQFMMRERGHRDRPLFAFEMWHEKLLLAALRAA